MRGLVFAALVASLAACNGRRRCARYRAGLAGLRCLRRRTERCRRSDAGSADTARLPTRLGRSGALRAGTSIAAHSGAPLLRGRGRVDRPVREADDQLFQSARIRRRLVALDRDRRMERDVQSASAREGRQVAHAIPRPISYKPVRSRTCTAITAGRSSKYRTTAYFWIEWSGVRNIRVTRHWRNLPLNPGDTIYVRIAATTTGPRAWQEATLWLVDETTGKAIQPRTFHSGCVDCGTPFSRPATLFGNTVEWITEATFYDADNPKWPNTLDDFGNVKMAHVDAVDQDGTIYDLAHSHGGVENVDWMTWNGLRLSEKGVLLACATVDAPREATFSRAPYVIATPGDQGKLKPQTQEL